MCHQELLGALLHSEHTFSYDHYKQCLNIQRRKSGLIDSFLRQNFFFIGLPPGLKNFLKIDLFVLLLLLQFCFYLRHIAIEAGGQNGRGGERKVSLAFYLRVTIDRS